MSAVVLTVLVMLAVFACVVFAYVFGYRRGVVDQAKFMVRETHLGSAILNAATERISVANTEVDLEPPTLN